MAKKNVKKQSKVKAKKKVWCKLFAPELFGSKEIGEMYVTAAQVAVGRPLKINLRELTGNMKDQNSHVSFRISKAQGTNLHTQVTGYNVTPSYIKRLVRKNTNRVDDYFALTTKDNKEVILKPFIITLHRTQHAVQTHLRHHMQETLKEELANLSFEQFMELVISQKIKGMLKKKLSKVFPVKEASIRVVKLNEKATPLTSPAATEETEQVTA